MTLLLCSASLLAGIGLGLLWALAWRATMAAQLSDARHAATHDPLTGLLNRAGWNSAAPALLDHVAATGHRAVLLVVDLDGFKAVNDTHGHAAGDAVLRAVAGRLSALVAHRGIVARLGGDEYAVLVTMPSADPADQLAADIRTAVAAPLPTTGDPLTVGASVGVTVLPAGTRRDADLSTALRQADHAMYRDKDRDREIAR